MNRLGVAVALVLALTACGSDAEVDRAAWRAALESQGVTASDAYQDEWLEACGEGLPFYAASRIDGGEPEAVVRINVEHACPDDAEAVSEALSDAESASLACEVPEAARTESQARLAEAMGC